MKYKFKALVRVFLCLLAVVPASGYGRGVYQSDAEFLAEVFAGQTPQVDIMWLTDERQTVIKKILGHPYKARRLRYWGVPGKTAWVLEEIGKEEPITTGIVIQGGKISLVRILAYRESRGEEVRHGFFTDQFKGAGMKTTTDLDRHVDGISGATLSVNAVTHLASMALYLHGSSRFAP
jgi:hypothetical protein